MPSEHRRSSRPPPLAYRPATQHGGGQRLAPATPSGNSHASGHGYGGSSPRTPSYQTTEHPTRRPSVSGSNRPAYVEIAPDPPRRERPPAHPPVSFSQSQAPRASGSAYRTTEVVPNYGSSDRGRSASRAPAPRSPGYAPGGSGAARRTVEVTPGYASDRRGRSTSRAPVPRSPAYVSGGSGSAYRTAEVTPAHASTRRGRSSSRPRDSSTQIPPRRRSGSTTRAPAPGSSTLAAPRPSNAASASDTTLYTMGVEIETILFPKVGAPRPLWLGRVASPDAETIAQLFNHYAARQRQLSCQKMLVQGDGRLQGSDKYRYWALMRDGSIGESDTIEEKAGVELVSPILKFDMSKAWRNDIGMVFSAIGSKWAFKPTHSCGTHVHIRPRNGWNMRDLKALAKAIVFFEDAIAEILPGHRVNNAYCMRNYHHNSRFEVEDGGLASRSEAYKFIGTYFRLYDLSSIH
ncbi:hypothetical protein VMCG_03771 [Cytospora schulzeri]|uniref:Amidoligase enzyme n=1 Tax=Cytospora schulzeri TaxID=448051 RepID=A0A423WUI1_9PEZI|nr:hypothetical protein VMCG_03771 [Valsa malicola]